MQRRDPRLVEEMGFASPILARALRSGWRECAKMGELFDQTLVAKDHKAGRGVNPAKLRNCLKSQENCQLDNDRFVSWLK